jgi:hypothetical protein
MNELETFKTSDGRFQFTVKGTFLHKCWEHPSQYDAYDLNSKFHLSEYLHNPSGPAIVHLGSGQVEYWLNGKKLTDEEGAKISHDYKFNNKLMEDLEK